MGDIGNDSYRGTLVYSRRGMLSPAAAADNRARHGRSKAEKARDKAETTRDQKAHEGRLLTPETDPEPPKSS